jgi:hypothetical protein
MLGCKYLRVLCQVQVMCGEYRRDMFFWHQHTRKETKAKILSTRASLLTEH